MQTLELRPFTDDDVPAAGELLAARHRRHRRLEPGLPAQFEEAAAAAAEVDAVWRDEGAAGAVARRGGRMVGYMIGRSESDSIWGANEWVPLAGHAVEEPEVVRDLYAVLAQGWVDAGRVCHYVMAPSGDAGLRDAWSRLSFGQQQALGICEVPAAEWPAGVRAAAAGDVDALIAIDPLLPQAHRRSPVFSTNVRPPDPEELRAEIEEDIASERIGCLVAEVNGRIVGNFVAAPVEASETRHVGLARPRGASYLAYAATEPAVRGTGVGLALMAATFAWAHRAGYRVMVTDWRVTNLLADRFWANRGFRTTFLRFYRAIP